MTNYSNYRPAGRLFTAFFYTVFGMSCLIHLLFIFRTSKLSDLGLLLVNGLRGRF